MHKSFVRVASETARLNAHASVDLPIPLLALWCLPPQTSVVCSAITLRMPTNSFSPGHLRRGLLFVLSAAVVAGVFHVALRHPLLLGSLLLVWWLAHRTRQYLARRKLQALLDSGDVTRLLEVWEGVPTTEPRARAAERLLRATALASYGWTARARATSGATACSTSSSFSRNSAFMPGPSGCTQRMAPPRRRKDCRCCVFWR